MIYYEDPHLTIRDFETADAYAITDEEIAQGWHQHVDKYLNRIKDRDSGVCIALCAVWDGSPVGYINVYPNSIWGPFLGKGFPEIVDFGVLEKCRSQGIGSKLMDAAEAIAAQYADTVYLGVGIYGSYGSAQRMYVKRGYVPDGSGAWYKEKPCDPYAEYPVDDNLVLYLSKKLK